MTFQYPIVMIVVCVVLVVSALSGLVKGFVRKISGIAAFLLAGVLVSALLPTITSALRQTPVYDAIRQQCQTVGDNLVKNTISGQINALTGGNDSGASGSSAASGSSGSAQLPSAITSGDGSGNIDRSKVKALLQQYGYDPSFIDNLSDSELQSYVQQYVGAYAGAVSGVNSILYGAGLLSVGDLSSLSHDLFARTTWEMNALLLSDVGSDSIVPGASGSGSSVLSQFTQSLSKVDQIKFIENLPIPEALKEQMESFNNAAGYVRLGASDFGSYIISYFANLILNIVAFLVTLLVSWLIIRAILGALSIFTHLPIFGAADRLLGLALGLVQGVLFVWGLFLLLSLFSTTPAGTALMAEINRTPFLELLYNSNLFMNTAVGAIKGALI